MEVDSPTIANMDVFANALTVLANSKSLKVTGETLSKYTTILRSRSKHKELTADGYEAALRLHLRLGIGGELSKELVRYIFNDRLISWSRPKDREQPWRTMNSSIPARVQQAGLQLIAEHPVCRYPQSRSVETVAQWQHEGTCSERMRNKWKDSDFSFEDFPDEKKLAR